MGEITLYQKGSEWRIWDLQVHPPGTKMSDNYLPHSDENLEKFMKLLSDSNVSVFGITDYFSIDGYINFVEKAKKISPEIFDSKVFFPNAEFRLDIKTNKRGEEIHLHLIFDNREDVLNRVPLFFAKLPLTRKRDSNSHFMCVEPDLKEVGYESAMVTLDSIDVALREAFGSDKCYLKITVVAGSGSNRAPQESSIRTKTTHDEIDLFSNAFFGKSSNQKYYLDTNRLGSKKPVRPKPVFSTSDCHSFEDCKNFIGKEFTRNGIVEKEITWIKADPTFEGLRQTLFEPEIRVRIQTEKPETKKTYLIIDKMKFLDNSGKNIFQNNEIELNPNLNVIIGGRSTGKSLLLYYTAKTIDKDEVDRRFRDVPPTPKYEEDMIKEMGPSDFDFEVIWKDGTINKFSQLNEEHRKILYIPQNYLSSLSGISPEKKNALNDFIFDVIMQDESVKSEYVDKKNTVCLIREQIDSFISEYFLLKAGIEDKKKKIEEMGDWGGINKYVKEIKRKIESLKKESGLTRLQIDELKKLMAERTELKRVVSVLRQDRESIDSLFVDIAQHFSGIQKLLSEKLGYIVDRDIKSLVEKKTDWATRMDPYLEKALIEIKDKITDKKKRAEEKLAKKEEKLKPLISLVKKQKEAQELIEMQKNEEEKINKIESLREVIKIDSKKLEELYKKVISYYKNIFKIYQELRVSLKKGQPQLENVILNIKIRFKETDFNEGYIQGYINRHDVKRVLNETTEQFYYKYDEKTHFDKISKIAEALMQGSLKPLNFRQPEEASRNLLDDYWTLDYSVTYEGDTLENMSPGKMSLTLLKLLIMLRSDSYPIFIDQPEADLDNRSVYTELVKYIKKKKIERQILLVTHNPNLVVGADAELVIVANQGQGENELYQFEYVSGSLENTKALDSAKKGVLFKQGIREHICEVLEGGEEAFKKREEKYNFSQ